MRSGAKAEDNQTASLRLDDFVMGNELENLALHSEALVASTVPGSAAEALADPNWKAAMQREYDSLMTNNGATADLWEVALCSESQ